MVSRPVKPRARRIALMVASVPELTKRTSSMDGMSSMTRRASRVSNSVGAPKLKPSAATSLHGFDHPRVRVAQDHRTPGADVSR